MPPGSTPAAAPGVELCAGRGPTSKREPTARMKWSTKGRLSTYTSTMRPSISTGMM